MRRKIVILGAGGHAKVLIDAIVSSGAFKIQGLLDNQKDIGASVSGYEIIGSDDFLQRNKNMDLALGIGSARATVKRKDLYEKYSAAGFHFPAVAHKNAYVSAGVILRDGVQVFAGAIINPGSEIRENVIVNTGVIVEHDCIVGAHTHLACGAVLAGGVAVGECCHIGMGAKILQGIRIGNHVTVGAGAVVISDIADGKIVAGVPAQETHG